MRRNAKELVTAVGQHTKTLATNATDLGMVANGLTRLRTSTSQQADAADALTTTLDNLRDGSTSTSVSEPA
jgi:hypothetical protein